MDGGSLGLVMEERGAQGPNMFLPLALEMEAMQAAL